MFPGHGTPTCMIFGAGRQPRAKTSIRVEATVSGGGDLQTPPEESPLWHTLQQHHENPGFSDGRVVVADRLRQELSKWPWNFDSGAEVVKGQFDSAGVAPLRDFLSEDVGFDVIFGARELYDNPSTFWRRLGVPHQNLIRFSEGDMLRDYRADETWVCLFPYNQKLAPYLPKSILNQFEPWRELLAARPQLGGMSQIEAGFEWYEFYRFTKRGQTPVLAFPELATHAHFVFFNGPRVFTQKAPVVKLAANSTDLHYHLLSGYLNASSPLLWLKTVCFSKRESEEAERDTYFEFGGSKVQQLPIPPAIADALRGKQNALAERLTALSRACWESGRELPPLGLRKLFEKSGEAYAAWNAALPGHVAPHAQLAAAFTTTAELQERFARAVSLREQLRAGMVARQEEMDWLGYAAYGLLPADHPAAQVEAEPAPLDQAQRPFRLWESAGGDFTKAVALIPAGWPKPRRALWEARLAAIRDNEHVRRIEQPVYKRRWDEQWKVGNRWMAGPVAYAQEFVDAFRWWLAEKAEWLLEHKAAGGPVELGGWTPALWKDKRIEAAWPVVADAMNQSEAWKQESKTQARDLFPQSEYELNRQAAKAIADNPPLFSQDLDLTASELSSLIRKASFDAFAKFLKATVADKPAPAGIPPAVPWDDLAAKKKWTSAQLKKAAAVRGKLNVPRERFRQT